MQSSPISALPRHGLADHRPLTDDRVNELGVGSDDRPGADHGAAFEDRAREEADVRLELDGRVDVRGGRVHHRHALAHPPPVDSGAELGFGRRELGAVVDVHRRGPVVRGDGEHLVTRVPEHCYCVGQVVLALRVLGAQTPQRRREQAQPEAVDRGVDLVDRELLGRRIGLLDDVVGPALVVADQPAEVRREVVELGGEQGRRGVGLAVVAGEPGQHLRAHERRVARHHQDIAVDVGVIRERRQTNADRVAGAALHALLDEFDRHLARDLLLERLGDPLGPVAHDDHDPLERQCDERVHHVEQHRPSTERMQHLGCLGAHTRTLTRGEDHGSQRPVATHRCVDSISHHPWDVRWPADLRVLRCSGARFRTSTWDSKGPRAAVTPPPTDPIDLTATHWQRWALNVTATASPSTLRNLMGSLIKKRRKRMRKKKHKKLLKKTRWQRRQQGR